MLMATAAEQIRAALATKERHLLRRQQVQAMTGMARSTLYKLIAEGGFPPPIKLTARAVAWPSDAVSAWIDSRVNAS
ncbi:helix-turn-helix transcriptional regulator [Hydrogenophaga defluvii]|uniref:Helix-turn-helix transcriptional regulator n=1 Tax=Hydrogenophaga defluvii TaxID=249410 RepID=A0ABW2SH17_9BURK